MYTEPHHRKRHRELHEQRHGRAFYALSNLVSYLRQRMAKRRDTRQGNEAQRGGQRRPEADKSHGM